jgi:ABC-2 type transport system permease protein
MEKIWLIVEREYITRVRKKSFIVMSILGPFLFAAIYIVPIWLTTQGGDEKVVQVLDESNLFNGKFDDTEKVGFVYASGTTIEAAKEEIKQQKLYDALLYIPPIDIDRPQGIMIFSVQGISAVTERAIVRTIEQEIEKLKLERSGIDREVLQSINTKVSVQTINLDDNGEKDSNAIASTIVGYVGGILVYFFIFLYGAQVMRGVIEEKTNRIVEVMISSVKPFHMMMGKILGISLVSMTQVVIWIFLGWAIITGVSVFAAPMLAEAQIEGTAALAQGENAVPEASALAQNEILSVISTLNFPLLIGAFVFYFLFGYLLYAGLFGAIGAAADSETDTQQFMLPITVPLILSIVMTGFVIQEPHGNVAFWMSMIPFTSPIIMMVRIPFIGVGWELFLSMFLLIFGYLFTTWLAAKIYRVGILMYGKKVNFRELAKWLFYKP